MIKKVDKNKVDKNKKQRQAAIAALSAPMPNLFALGSVETTMEEIEEFVNRASTEEVMDFLGGEKNELSQIITSLKENKKKVKKALKQIEQTISNEEEKDKKEHKDITLSCGKKVSLEEFAAYVKEQSKEDRFSARQLTCSDCCKVPLTDSELLLALGQDCFKFKDESQVYIIFIALIEKYKRTV